MPQYPSRSRYSSLSSSFNERAAPRISDTGNRRYHHAVVPVSQRTGTPHYAQPSELYPMEARSDSVNPYRYRPSDGLGSPNPPLSGCPSSGQAVLIPVVHLGPNRDLVSSSTPSDFPLHLDSPMSSLSRSGVGSPTPLFGGSLTRTSKKISPSEDSEAVVDALTNELMRSMETRTQVGASGITSLDSGLASPAGNIRRLTGLTSSGSLPGGRIRSLQQQQQTSTGVAASCSSPVSALNGGRGSPLTISTGSPRTSSPTSSNSSTVGDPLMQNICFKCRRPLVPPEGSTLGPTTASANVVTLTGALAVRLHAACFTCYLCRTPLAPNAYYHRLHRLLCPTCVRDGAVESCANCERPIGERIVRALGHPYHPSCFVCIVCNCRLDSRPFTVDVHGRSLCLEDFHRRYAPRCGHCNRPIVPEAGSIEARRVVAGQMDYHLQCYRNSLAASSGAADAVGALQQQQSSGIAMT